MADGDLIFHGRVISSADAGLRTLADAERSGHPVTRCWQCDHREALDSRLWRQRAFDRGLPLAALSNRLRCLCGGRQVGIEVWPVTPGKTALRTYCWRA